MCVDKLLLWMSHRYFIPGYDREDIMQELELVRAMVSQSWKPGRSANYRTYLTVCVKRHFSGLIRRSSKNPELPPPAESYTAEPSFIMSEARKLFQGVKHEKTRKILLQMLDLTEADADVEPSGDGPICKAAGVSRKRVHQMLVDVRKTPAFRKFREELYA